MQPESAASLRRLLEQYRPIPVTRGYPPEVRARVVAGVRQLIREGRRIENLAPELGVSRTCLGGWLRAVVVDARSFAPVVIAEAAPVRPFAATSMAAGVVISPGGYRVEGLDLEGIASLLRRLP